MNMTEALTRSELVDKQLAQSGWNVEDRSQVAKEFEISGGLSEDGLKLRRQFCDYVLLGRNGRPMAVVEAKQAGKDPKLGLEQAKQYCFGIQRQLGGELPFCFCANGSEILFWDVDQWPARTVAGFPTRDDLERLQHIRRRRMPLVAELIDEAIAGRDYQKRAIWTVLEGVGAKQRRFLLVMATGTGKTRVCVAIVQALMRAGHVERTLFLVDRIALQEQALRTFKEHLPNEPRWPDEDERQLVKDRRIYVATCPTMLGLVRSEHLSPHFFDLVVVDESHRSIYNTFGEILDYFDAVALGLTATPTSMVDHNTYRLFCCEDGVPSFSYSLEEALGNDPPWLCDFRAMKIQTRFQSEGINRRTISLKDQKKLLLEGKDVEEINFEGSQLERQVVNKGTNVLIVREFMEECIKDSNGVLPGKTIFFCASKDHARRIEEIFNALFPQFRGELAKAMLSEDSRVHGRNGLREQFQGSDMPRVAISVDMLDTGIDVREIVNLVFAKPVCSATKFWQMIGRGTRRLDNGRLKPWCPEKDVFLILDCWDNFEYFRLKPQGKELKPQLPLPVRLAGLRLDKIELAGAMALPDIAEREIVKLRRQIGDLPKSSVVIREAAAILGHIAEDDFWSSLDERKLEFLREELKPLFRTASESDFKAMRFERDLLEHSLACLCKEQEKADAIRESIVSQIAELPLSIGCVRAEEALIRAAQSSGYWTWSSPVAREDALDELCRDLGPLMQFREQKALLGSGQVRLDLADVLHGKEWVEFGPWQEPASIDRYLDVVRELVARMAQTHPVLQKIKAGQDVSDEDLGQLSAVLGCERPRVDLELLRRACRNKRATLQQLVRHLLGVERLKNLPEAADEAFGKFVRERPRLDRQQLAFVELLKNFIVEHEQLERKDLIRPPFTVIHPSGIRGVFGTAEIGELLQLAKDVLA